MNPSFKKYLILIKKFMFMKIKLNYSLNLIFLIILFSGLSNIKAGDSLAINKPQLAYNFYLEDLNGHDHFLNDYCGTKRSKFRKNQKCIVLFSFWATWCIPCREEFKILEKLSKTYSQESFKIFLINIEEPYETVKHFAEENNIKIPILLDRYGVVRKNYNVTSIPSLFLINPDQYIVYQHSGYNPDEPLFDIILQKIDSLFIEYFGAVKKKTDESKDF